MRSGLRTTYNHSWTQPPCTHHCPFYQGRTPVPCRLSVGGCCHSKPRASYTGCCSVVWKEPTWRVPHLLSVLPLLSPLSFKLGSGGRVCRLTPPPSIKRCCSSGGAAADQLCCSPSTCIIQNPLDFPEVSDPAHFPVPHFQYFGHFDENLWYCEWVVSKMGHLFSHHYLTQNSVGPPI